MDAPFVRFVIKQHILMRKVRTSKQFIEAFEKEDFELGTTMDGDNTEINYPKLKTFLLEREKEIIGFIEGEMRRYVILADEIGDKIKTKNYDELFTKGIARTELEKALCAEKALKDLLEKLGE